MKKNTSSEEAKPLGRRTLAAIMFTDVVDSSRLMGDNEEHTMVLIDRDLRVISELCRKFEGRVLKLMGDGALVIFNSGVHAVECAQEIQRHFAEQARTLPKSEVLQHRIGVHLGDVYVTEDEAMGDGVNVAARLQAEAPPGGICISQALYEVVKTRLSLQTVYQGPKHLKNIKEEVHLYQIVVSEEAAPKTSSPPVSVTEDRSRHKKLLWGVGLLTVLVVGLITFQAIRKSSDSDVLPEKSPGSMSSPGNITPASGQDTTDQDESLPLDDLQMFQRLDRNNDKKLTKDELPEKVCDRIMRADKNQDGAVTISELKETLSQQWNRSLLQVFRQFDRNGDKKITPDELPERICDRIMRADRNLDGIVTESELREVLK